MEDKDLEANAPEEQQDSTPVDSTPAETHEEHHESKLHHLIHEITEEVKDLFDLDTFLHSNGSITGGINGATEDEEEGR